MVIHHVYGRYASGPSLKEDSLAIDPIFRGCLIHLTFYVHTCEHKTTRFFICVIQNKWDWSIAHIYKLYTCVFLRTLSHYNDIGLTDSYYSKLITSQMKMQMVCNIMLPSGDVYRTWNIWHFLMGKTCQLPGRITKATLLYCDGRELTSRYHHQ
jgi:hypothetical protein